MVVPIGAFLMVALVPPLLIVPPPQLVLVAVINVPVGAVIVNVVGVMKVVEATGDVDMLSWTLPPLGTSGTFGDWPIARECGPTGTTMIWPDGFPAAKA